MKLTIHRNDLHAATSWAVKNLPARPTVPVLAGLKLTAVPGYLTVGAFDYDTAVQATATGASVTEPGSVLVPGKLFANIVASLPSKPVDFDSDGNQLTIKYGTGAGSKFSIYLLPVDEYPAFPELPAATGTCAPAALVSAVASVIPAVSSDTSLPTLTAVNLEATAKGLTLAATDRYELAAADLEWTPADASMDDRVALVPGATLALFAQGLPDSGTVTVSYPAADGDANTVPMIGFASDVGGRTVTVRCIAGEYPKWRGLFRNESATSAVVDAAELAAVVRRVGVAARDKTPIRFTVADGEIRMSAGAEDGTISGSESLPAETEGDKVAIGFRPDLLLNAIGPVTGNVRIRLDGPAKAGYVTRADDDSFRALIMPMKLDDKAGAR